MGLPSIARDICVTLLSSTHTTNWAAYFTGATPFLPALFASRFCLLGGIDVPTFASQLKACSTFDDAAWAKYWSALAAAHLDAIAADDDLCAHSWVHSITSDGCDNAAPSKQLQEALARGARLLTDAGPLRNGIDALAIDPHASPSQVSAYQAVDHMLKAMTYYFCAAWPGKRPKRQEAYVQSKRVFDVLLDGVAAPLGFMVERHTVQTHDESICMYAILPLRHKGDRLPAIFIGNGLEGTNQEVLIPMLRIYGNAAPQTAFFFAEMPGTYAYAQPMAPGLTENIYRDLFTHVLQHHAVDATKFGIHGLSFGAHWATRMLLCDDRIRAAVINGAPIKRTFGMSGVLGVPEIMTQALANASGATNPLALLFKLRALSLEKSQLAVIQVPVLVINGDNDTLCSTQDSIDLADSVDKATLQLYPNDDHCAMAHYEEHMRLSYQYLVDKW